ncbi:T9SS type A sorting domain-containing protein [Desertivirga xinjiangensis]|uniref:T9SS type A sorting domain-containing protein n=1 Tax=Desertivirga xinjiangensis TaxID=539206 RepID=UPI0021087C3C|nr:T9SS type A sorting domain-containing protein [Pedobacter xinjiangensis]
MKKNLLVLGLLFSRLLSFGQWSNDAGVNTPIVVKDESQVVYNAINDGTGGLILAWGDDTGSDGQAVFRNKLLLQRLSAAGFKQWGEEGKRVSESLNHTVYGFMVPDGTGGCFVAWVENINDDESTSDIYAQRIDAHGNRLWGNNGVVVCNSPEEQYASNMVPDGAGGVVISWTDNRSEGELSRHVYAQRFNGGGAAQWATNGVPVSDNEGDILGALVYPDGSGGFTVLWNEETVADDVYGSRTYWQKLNLNGSRKSATTNTLIFDFAPSANFVDLAGFVPDGAGGFYVGITTDDDVTAKLYLQHVLNNGTKTFNNTPLGIEVDPSIGRPSEVPGASYLDYQVNMESDNAGGVVMAWTGVRSAEGGYFAQRINASGTKFWGANGVTVVPEFIQYLGAMGLVRNQGGDFVFLISKGTTFGNSLLYAQKISAAGAVQYAPGGNIVSSVQSPKFGFMIPFADNVAVIWSDLRTFDGYDIYAQNVPLNGVLPVRFAGFNVRYENQQSKLSWSTASELNNDRFEIERSNDGRLFSAIGSVKGSGTATQTSHYSYSDPEAFSESGYLYYRIKQVDFNGDFNYSEVQPVKVPLLQASEITYYPNPVTDKLMVSFKKPSDQVQYSLTDISGRLVFKRSDQYTAGPLEVNLTTVPSGVYILSVKSGNKVYNERIVKK